MGSMAALRSPPPMPGVDVPGYLARIGISDPGRPSVDSLFALHRAHVEHVSYEALDIQLGRPTPLDPHEAAARIVAGRGGYCYQLNGAFSALLTALGYRVTWHRAGVQNHGVVPPGVAWANHLTLTVSLERKMWLADVGLGDALHEPLTLQPGVYRQGPFSYRLDHSSTEPGGWRFEHDAQGAFAGFDLEIAAARLDQFAERHLYFATSPESGYLRTSVVLRRDGGGVDNLTGCVLHRTDGTPGRQREVETADEWFAILADVFGLTLTDLDATDRARLWAKVRAAHEAWQGRGRV